MPNLDISPFQPFDPRPASMRPQPQPRPGLWQRIKNFFTAKTKKA